jgi:transposase
MLVNNNIHDNFNSKQLRLPLDLDILIDFNDPVYTFDEVLRSVELSQYLVSDNKDPRGRIGYNPINMLKVILFGFMTGGYESLRNLESLCRNDIRFRWLLKDEDGFPSHQTISNFMNTYLKDSIEDIFKEINTYIFKKDKVDLEHLYIDGTKMEANANKYSWVWKKACLTSRDRLYKKISNLLETINSELLCYECFRYGLRETYEIEYLEDIVHDFTKRFSVDESSFVYGKGHRKTCLQRHYETLISDLEKLKDYAHKVLVCGEKRNSYSKTDLDATFMRVKRDYMGNDQLLPAYNLQIGVSDEYISVVDVNQYASDSDCLIPLIEKFNHLYHRYPAYAIGDAGYGSYNNYLYCESHDIQKYMKFSMYKKETENTHFREDPFRAVNFKRDLEGHLLCPNQKRFFHLKNQPVKGNKFERSEEIYQCEDCSDCPLRSACHKGKDHRTIKLNEELTAFHQEVIGNLQSTQGMLLRMNRSIQAEGAFGILKYDRFYKRIVRRGLNSVNLEIFMVSIGFNLLKYHHKKFRIVN